jgi:succinoglycan biosynthesis transport protein ExoP
MATIAKVLGVTARPGLTEVFAGKASLSEAIHPSGQANTYVLPAGVCHVNPHHVIHGSSIDELFDDLRAKFSTILVDMPPILGASESLVYAKAADLVVFCSLSSVSRARQVRGAVERLQTTGANVVGAVLSGIPIRRNSYAYGYSGDADNLAEVDS